MVLSSSRRRVRRMVGCGAGCRDRMRPRADLTRDWTNVASSHVRPRSLCSAPTARSPPSARASRRRRGRGGRHRPLAPCVSRARNRRAKIIVRPRSASSGLTRSRRASATTAKSRSPIATSGSPASAAQSSPCSASASPSAIVLDARERVPDAVERARDGGCLVEADARRTFLHALRMRERRQRSRHAVEQRETLALLRFLELLPVDDDAGGVRPRRHHRRRADAGGSSSRAHRRRHRRCRSPRRPPSRWRCASAPGAADRRVPRATSPARGCRLPRAPRRFPRAGTGEGCDASARDPTDIHPGHAGAPPLR